MQRPVGLQRPVGSQIQVGDRLFEYVAGLYTGWVPVADAPAEPMAIRWTGGKLPWDEYRKMITFFRWTYHEFKGEAQARLAYNEATKIMKIVVLPQRASQSMTTKEIEDHPDRVALQEAALADGSQFCGTAHHHCGGSASASGTDNNDELRQPGIHITIGKVDEKAVDYEARVTFRGHKYEKKDIDLSDWISTPTTVPVHLMLEYYVKHPDKVVIKDGTVYLPQDIPEAVLTACFDEHMRNPIPLAFPEEWKERMVAAPQTVATNFRGSWERGNSDFDGGVNHQRTSAQLVEIHVGGYGEEIRGHLGLPRQSE